LVAGKAINKILDCNSMGTLKKYYICNVSQKEMVIFYYNRATVTGGTVPDNNTVPVHGTFLTIFQSHRRTNKTHKVILLYTLNGRGPCIPVLWIQIQSDTISLALLDPDPDPTT